MLLVVLTGRLMGPSGRGLYALASLSVGLCQVPFGSVWIANAVELSRRRATPRELFGVSIVVATGGGLLTCLVALAISPLLGERWWVLALPSLITPFVLLRAYQEGIWQAVGHVRAVNVLGSAAPRCPSCSSSRHCWPMPRRGHDRHLGARLRGPGRDGLVQAPRLHRQPQFPRDRGLYRRVTTYGLTFSASGSCESSTSASG